MRKHRHLPLVAVFSLLLSGITMTHAQQQSVMEVNKRDIVFLVDGSSSLGQANFNAIRDFISRVIQRLEIGQDLVQVSVAQYADTVKPEFYLNTYSTKKDAITTVRKMKALEGSALYTGSALDFVRNNLFTSSAGHRAAEGVPKLLVLITGGKSLDDVSQAAQELQKGSIMALVIGSRAADEDELKEIAFDSSLVFIPAEFRPAPLQSMLPSLMAPLRTLTGTTEGMVAVVCICRKGLVGRHFEKYLVPYWRFSGQIAVFMVKATI